MNLYEINSALLALVDEETGEITDWEAFDALQMAREEKIENVALWYKNLMAEASAIRQEELSLALRRRRAESRADSLKRYLESALDGQKFSTPRCAVSFRKTAKVEVREPALAIAWALTNGHGDVVKYLAPEISKDGLKALLKDGNEIPGAELVTGASVSVK